jgi:hypothetical protein
LQLLLWHLGVQKVAAASAPFAAACLALAAAVIQECRQCLLLLGALAHPEQCQLQQLRLSALPLLAPLLPSPLLLLGQLLLQVGLLRLLTLLVMLLVPLYLSVLGPSLLLLLLLSRRQLLAGTSA